MNTGGATRTAFAMITASVVALGCAESAPARGDHAEDPLDVGKRFVQERAYRRQALEQSLWSTDNGYARLRLERYGIVEHWESLPELRPHTARVRYENGRRRVDEPVARWAGEVEWDEAALLELGHSAFETWPSQPLPNLDLALGDREDAVLQQRLGLWKDATGWIGGLVEVEYETGARALAATCATCHARPAGQTLRAGPASDVNLDGEGQPGRLDVTADAQDNPVSIPDLRATAMQSALHWSGNVTNDLATLSVRIETLLVTNAGQTTRPPRQLAFALALYITRLAQEPGRTPLWTDNADIAAGERLFEAQCQRCHSGSTGEGAWVPAEDVGGDSAAAFSPERGTGGYRVPSLRLVAERTRLTHWGFAGSLFEFLEASRVNANPGHEFGFELSATQRARLVAYLTTL